MAGEGFLTVCATTALLVSALAVPDPERPAGEWPNGSAIARADVPHPNCTVSVPQVPARARHSALSRKLNPSGCELMRSAPRDSWISSPLS